MVDVLTQNEIDQLVHGSAFNVAPRAAADISPADLALTKAFTAFAGDASRMLSRRLQMPTSVTLDWVSHATVGAYARSLFAPYSTTVHMSQEGVIVDVSHSLIGTFAHLLCADAPERDPLSAGAALSVRSLIAGIVPVLSSALNEVGLVNVHCAPMSDVNRFPEACDYTEAAALALFDIDVDEAIGLLGVCIPERLLSA